MTTLSTWIPGVPVPQGSLSAFPITRKDGKPGVRFANKKGAELKEQRERIRLLVGRDMQQNGLPLAPRGAVVVMATFVLPRPPSHYGTGKNAGTLRSSAPKWHTSKPDVDKFARALLDSLGCQRVAGGKSVPGIGYHDDAQVDRIQASKRWVTPGNSPGIDLRLEWLD